MGIDATTLKLRIVSTDIVMSPEKTYEHLSYEVFHAATGAVVASNKMAQQLTDAAQLQAVDTALVNRALAEFAAAKWQFGSVAEWGGFSPYDVSLILERWSFEKENGNWKLTHPTSGAFEDVAIAGTPFPAIIDRAAAIISKVLPPPVWVFASTPGAGQLSVNCVAVAGATGYAVYQDHGDGAFTLLGSPATAAGGTVEVAAGYYIVRMGAVKVGVVGILGHPVSVSVA